MQIPEPVHLRSTSDAIYKKYESNQQENRPHLGASEIGKECSRALWYSFRWVTQKKFEGRMLRLFNTGIREEVRFLEELRSIGVEVHDKDENGNQINFSALGGHFGGSCDGIGKGFPEAPKTWAVVEFKTHSAKSFATLVKDGVEKHKPEHFAQMMIYMGLAELDRALYLAVNKDTDQLHCEWIHFNKELFESLLKKAYQIINSQIPLEKISQDPSWFKCKFCDHQSVCHGGVIPKKNCRTCAFSTPREDGQWHCARQKRALSMDDQRLGCREHLYIPALISFAEATDMGPDFVAYQLKNGFAFANKMEGGECKEMFPPAPTFSSAEIQGANAEVIQSEAVLELKEVGATLSNVEVSK